MSGETFESLLAPALPAVRQFVRARIRTPEYTEDVVQQTLMHAFAHRDQLRAHSKFKSWIVSIAMNEIRGLARRKKVCLPLEALGPFALSDPSACPHKVFEDGERVERLYAGLALLRPRERDAIHLLDLGEVSLTDAAQALRVSQAALKSAHFRARQRLKANTVHLCCGADFSLRRASARPLANDEKCGLKVRRSLKAAPQKLTQTSAK